MMKFLFVLILFLPALLQAAFRGNGRDAAIDVGSVQEPTTAITLYVVVESTAVGGQQNKDPLEKQFSPTDPWLSYRLGQTNNNANLTPFMSVSIAATPGSLVSAQSATVLKANIPYILTGTWSSGNPVKLYINGILDVASTNQTGTIPYLLGDHTYIGKDVVDTTWFGGIVHSVAIWDIALSATEVAQASGGKYNPLTVQPNHLVGFWTLDEYPEGALMPGTATIKDFSGYGRNGTPEGQARGAGSKVTYP